MDVNPTFDVSVLLNLAFHTEEVAACKSFVKYSQYGVGLIVDANNVMYRLAFAMSKDFAHAEDMAAAFEARIESVVNMVTAQAVVTCFDKGTPLRRSLLGAERKANKTPEQEAVIQMARDALDLAMTREYLNPRFMDGYEADDIAAAYAVSGIFTRSIIYSTDSDLYQVTDANSITQLSPSNGRFLVSEMPPLLVAPAKALMGDASDNIQGIKGVGPKTAIAVLIGDKTLSLSPDEVKRVSDNVLLTYLPFPGSHLAIRMPINAYESQRRPDDDGLEGEIPF